MRYNMKRVQSKLHIVGTHNVSKISFSCFLNGIKMQVFFGKNIEKSTCAVMKRIIITFGNQILV